MGERNSYSFAFGPMVALVAVLVLVFLLRWAFSRGGSLVERRHRSGTPDDYGLLVQIAAPASAVEAEMLRLRLVDAGLRATLAPTTTGPGVMVFAADEARARRLLAGPAPGAGP